MELDGTLLVGSVVVIAAVLFARIGSKFGLPSLLLFLGLGLALGESGLGIRFDDADLAHTLGFAALVLILTEGGLTTRWVEIKTALPVAGLLATAGIGISVGAMFLFGHYVLHLPAWTAVLLGAVCSPTDSAAVFSVLRKVPLPTRLRSMLEAESGLNDAPTVLLVTAASAMATGESMTGGVLGFVANVGFELIGGVLFGLVIGWLGVVVLRNVALPSSGLYPLTIMVWAVMAYAVAATLHTSGFAAVYVCAVLLGNGQLPHRQATKSFGEGIGWIAQIGLFVMLGLLADPGRITWHEVVIALLAGVFLIMIARPLSVYLCAVWFKVPLPEQAFLAWAGLRGAVPIILATIPLVAGVAGADFLFDVVLVFVVVFTLLQAPTLPWVARKLGLVVGAATDVEVEAAPLEGMKADLIQVRVPEGSHLAGVEVSELRLPANTVVSLIIRGEESFAPSGRTPLKIGDEVLVVAPASKRAEVEERLRVVGKGGRLAKWRMNPLVDPETD